MAMTAIPSASVTFAAADTVRGVPMIGATAIRMPWSCSTVTPASVAAPMCIR